jgi:hypothetical protein
MAWTLILQLLAKLWKPIAGALLYLGVRRSGGKAAEASMKEKDQANARGIEDRADEARKRAAADKRSADERLREHGRLRGD